jgi:AcrR family transcriptional regulator
MAVRNLREKPPREGTAAPPTEGGGRNETAAPPDRPPPAARERYRRLPSGSHGLDRETVRRDQRERLQSALIELIEQKGYPGVRIVDLARLARVSQPTFYGLYRGKEDLFIATYDGIARRTARAIVEPYTKDGPHAERVGAALRSLGGLLTAEPHAMSLFLLGAFGAGPSVLAHRRRRLEELEQRINARRDPEASPGGGDLTVKFLIGGFREVAVTRLRAGRGSELHDLAGELAAWAHSYPVGLPPGLASSLAVTPARPPAPPARERRGEGRLPSGRSDLPRELIARSQRERIVNATAAIAAEKGLAKLTVPEIARRANISHQTFYELYASKQEAYLGAQRTGMREARRVIAEASGEHRGNWPLGVASGLRALIDYLVSEPAHAHLSIVDTFAACPEAIEIRGRAMDSFIRLFRAPPGEDPERPLLVSEAIVGGAWQVLHHFVANDLMADLPAIAPQLIYLSLAPFLGSEAAAEAAVWESA